MNGSEMLFYAGSGCVCVTAMLAVIATVVLRISWKRLKKKLTEEYGEKLD